MNLATLKQKTRPYTSNLSPSFTLNLALLQYFPDRNRLLFNTKFAHDRTTWQSEISWRMQMKQRTYCEVFFSSNFGFLGGSAIGGSATCGSLKATETSVPEMIADTTVQTSRVVSFSNMPSVAITRWLASLPIFSQPVHSGSALTPNLHHMFNQKMLTSTQSQSWSS